MPYTPREDTANRNRRPISISTNTPVSEKGITHQPSRLKSSVKTGAKTKLKVLALVGITVSLSNSFNPSAKGCNKPQKPTTLGPFRCCIAAITFLSAKVR
jgi:hypothetical protein